MTWVANMQAKLVWPEADLKAMQTQIDRAVSDLSKPVEAAIDMAVYHLVRSAVAATKTAPKKRTALQNKKKKGRFNLRRFPYYRKVKEKGKQLKFYRFYIKEKTDTTHEKISKSGFAKLSWIIMKNLIKQKGGKKFASEVLYKSKGLSRSVELANRLSYILDALRIKNTEFVLNQAMGKGSRSMEKAIDDKIKKMTK